MGKKRIELLNAFINLTESQIDALIDIRDKNSLIDDFEHLDDGVIYWMGRDSGFLDNSFPSYIQIYVNSNIFQVVDEQVPFQYEVKTESRDIDEIFTYYMMVS